MIPVDQTLFYDPEAPPEKQRGNCLTAVVASLLEVSIEDVPNFVQDHIDHGEDDAEDAGDWNWWTRLHRFVQSHKHQLYYLRNVEDPHAVDPAIATFPDPEPDEYYTVSGISPRDSRIHHIVIYQNGKMVHDPHPDRTGLDKIVDEYHWTLRKISDV